MNITEIEVLNYIRSIQIHRIFISSTYNLRINCSQNNVKKIANDRFSVDCLTDFIKNNKKLFKNVVLAQYFNELLNPVYFTVKELKEIQASDDPFSREEINDIMIQELEKDNYRDIDCDVVNYCLEVLNNTENVICTE